MIRAVGWLRVRWHNVRYGFLFIPGAIGLAFVAFAFLMTEVDGLGGPHGVAGFGGDAPTARSILSTIATALITVSGVTFSITVVSLQLVSQQFSPRALRNFLGDRTNQIVAGSFIGIFGYCLVVLRSIRQGRLQPDFVPGLSVTVGIALGVLTLALLLAFIHHMSRSIQLSSIAAGIAQAALTTTDRLYPDTHQGLPDGDADVLVGRWRLGGAGRRVFPRRAGFVQAVAVDELPRELGDEPANVRLLVAVGDFVTPATPLLELWSGAGEREATAAVRAVVAVEDERDAGGDVGHSLRQLADIAIKALSPGVNDPTTAVTCIGYMQAILERLATRAWPPAVRRCGRVVAVLRLASFGDLLAPLAEIGMHARDEPRAAEAVRGALEAVAEQTLAVGADERCRVVREAAASLGMPRGGRHTRSGDASASGGGGMLGS